MKRLAGLEQSSNLAIQYMDAQSDMLRELLANLDRRLAVVEGNVSLFLLIRRLFLTYPLPFLKISAISMIMVSRLLSLDWSEIGSPQN